MSTMIRGKELALEIRQKIAVQVDRYQQNYGKRPGLAVIQVGENPASTIYVSNKKKACEEAGIRSYGYQLPADVSQMELLTLIDTLNHDTQVHEIGRASCRERV